LITARQVAADVLHRSREHQGFAAELIDDALTRGLTALGSPGLSPQDRRFVTQLVFGVMRRKGTLDALLKPFMRIPAHAVEPRVWDVLHLGAFQLAFLTQVPKHAAVNETVELAIHIGSAKAKGFINGVMHRIAELVTDEFTDAPGADAIPFEMKPSSFSRDPESSEGSGIASRALPSEDTGSRLNKTSGRYRKLTRPILPDPIAEPAAHLAASHSWPLWLASRWIEQFGVDECHRLGFWFNAPPPLWIRTNKLHNSREEYRIRLAAEGIGAEPGEHPQSLRLLEHHGIRGLPGYDAGDFAVQDHSSLLPPTALAPQPGMHVLDLCSAPGGKTTHLAELMENRGTITACDIDPKRLETVTALCQRMKITCVETVAIKEFDDPPWGPFDAALVDVPCSNTGVLGRRPEVRWRMKPGEFEYLIRLQTKLLHAAVDRVKSQGTIVYSTCSIDPDENRGVVSNVLRAFKGLRLEAEHTAIPGQPSDGGYWARLRKA
jgi:16S rRNA (cytosine967-C5)-methyltransferase